MGTISSHDWFATNYQNELRVLIEENVLEWGSIIISYKVHIYILYIPGPDSRNHPLVIGLDTILWKMTNHSLGNLELKLRGRDWIKDVRLMISIHDVTMGGVATSFMSADTRASWPVQCTHTVFSHDTTQFGHAIFDRYVCVINVIENIQIVDTKQTMFKLIFPGILWILAMVKLLIKWPTVVMKFLIQHRS